MKVGLVNCDRLGKEEGLVERKEVGCDDLVVGCDDGSDIGGMEG